jgi:uncharacterized protein YkwD
MNYRRLVLISALAALLLPVVAAPVSAESAAVEPAIGAQLMVLTNADRAANNLPALASDATLMAVATDRSFVCPSNSALRPNGRAMDMAVREYFAHPILGCNKPDGSGYLSLDILYSQFGYNTNRAENIGWNDYPSDQTAVQIEQAFMKSTLHREAILGHYDRFGCGAVLANSGKYFYACLFSLGGPELSDAPKPAPDRTAPKVSNRTPGTNIRNVSRDATIKVTFSEPVKGLSTSSVRLVNVNTGAVVRAVVRYGDTAHRVIEIDPVLLLSGNLPYGSSSSRPSPIWPATTWWRRAGSSAPGSNPRAIRRPASHSRPLFGG